MKKFLIRTLLVLALCILIIKGTDIFYKNFIDEDKDGVTKFYNMPFNIELANLGSSHGQCSFNYSQLGEYKTFNFALNGQSLEYDKRILEEYVGRMAEDSVMIIPVSYVSFFLSDENLSEADFETKNNRYYSFLSYDNIMNADLMTYIKLRYLPLFYSNMRRDIVNYLDSKLFGNEIGTVNEVAKRQTTPEEAANDAIAAYDRHIDDYYIDGKYQFNEKLVQELYDIINLCKKNNIRPVLVTTPFLKDYNDLVPSEFLEEFHEIVDNISSDTGAVYIDYSNDERFCERYELFINSDHLNEDGAVMFTGIIYEEHLKAIIEE